MFDPSAIECLGDCLFVMVSYRQRVPRAQRWGWERHVLLRRECIQTVNVSRRGTEAYATAISRFRLHFHRTEQIPMQIHEICIWNLLDRFSSNQMLGCFHICFNCVKSRLSIVSRRMLTKVNMDCR